MGSEIGVQLALIEAKRGGLAAGHGLLDSFDFLLHTSSGPRAGGNDRGRRRMKYHQQSNDCGGVGGPADDAEDQAQRTGLARWQSIGPSAAVGGRGGVHAAAPWGEGLSAYTNRRGLQCLGQENAGAGA